MESTQPSKRKNRSKSASSKSPTEPTETAANLNGNKDGGTDEQETPSSEKPTEETPTSENKPTQGRKRKASEMKSDSSGGEEASNEKETKEIIEPERKIEVKVEPGLNDDEQSPLESRKDDLTMPPKQTLGKGKRARIPNKRYSDIMITSPKLEKIRKFENGDVQDNITEKENAADSENTVITSLKMARNSMSSPSPHFKRVKLPVDLSNPNFLKPFQYGWKRELVYRATTDSSAKRNGDIYYYTPHGKKVRSMREVSENLKNKELTLDDFTFYKEPLGLEDPEKEIIRDAKVKFKEHPSKTSNRLKVSSPKLPPPPPAPAPTLPAVQPATDSPKSTKNPSKTGGGFKVKLPSKGTTPKGKIDKKQKENDAEMEVGTYPPNWSAAQPKAKTGTTKWGNNLSENEEKQQPCSIRCENVWKPIPSLQCRYCLCLYHNECVGLSPLASVEAYVCKNCQLRQQPTPGTIQALHPPPPLTPISTIKSAVAAAATTSSTSSSTVSVPPKLQRIPKPQDVHVASTPSIVKPLPPVPKPDLPKLTPRPGLATAPKFVKINNLPEQIAGESKSLVGSVTTWFPPSSTIQVANDRSRVNDIESHSPPRPQFVEILGNRKYLIVPKHNILSVSPAIASVNNKSEDFVTTPDLLNVGSDNVDEIAAEAAKIPPSPRLSTEEIKSEPHSPSVLNVSDENLPEPMEVDTPPSIPMEIDPPDIEPEKNEITNENIPIPPAISEETNNNNANNCEERIEVIEEGEPIKEEIQEIQQLSPQSPPVPNEDDNVIEESKESLEEEKESTAESDLERTVRRGKASNKPKLPPTTADDKPSNIRMDSKFMENYLQNLAYGYGTLLYVFQYLKVQDLLRAGCVCTMWRDVANHPILWRTVRMKNSQIHSFEGLADTLQKHGTVNLDLRKMLLPNGGDDLWPSFSSAISKVDSLRKIELCRCPAVVVEQLATTNPKLEVINAVTIKCETMSLNPFVNVVSLQELRLKSTAGLSLTSDLSAIKELTHLKHLSLTSIKDLNRLNIDVIADLSNLESLDLGECTDFPNTFGSGILTRLEKLEKLRLEKGQGTCYTFEILEAVKNMPKLEQLELVNFDIKSGFDKALGACTNIKKLLIIPTYISQSATTNHMVLGGVLRLQSTLSHFVWGVTLELLRVTELFVDQCEDSEKKDKKERKPAGNGDSIPVLKPVPFLGELSEQSPQTTEPPQVEILPLPNLQKLLLQNLPTTRVKILKIPFHATWRQTITDTVN